MKEYFTRYKSKLPEYVDMKRIAIRKMWNDGANYKQIAEVIGISPQAVSKLHKKKGKYYIGNENYFHETIEKGIYPIFENKRLVWRKL